MEARPNRPFRLATWNVNSVRARLDHVQRFLADHGPDLLCLQETKVRDDAFPRSVFEDMGYRHIALRGQPNHHGVAILSREPFEASDSWNWVGMEDARHVTVTIGGVDIHNFYVPAGGDEPDTSINPRFAHKLSFLEEMIGWARRIEKPTILAGDLNIAPLETDVWSHRKLIKVVSHTPVEVALMEQLREAHDWVDVMRHFVPEQTPLFTWWSYRARDWQAANRGRRLDHVWVSPSLKPRLQNMTVATATRSWEKPSDHVPVVVDIDLD